MARRKRRAERDDPPAQVIVAMILLALFACAAVLATIKQFFQLHPILGSAIAVALVVALIVAAVFFNRAVRRKIAAQESERVRLASANSAAWQQSASMPASTEQRNLELMRASSAHDWRASGQQARQATSPTAQTPWTEARIAERMRAIDWYQFEKLNAAILTREGWTVERKGGAAPDGGVDLIAVKDGVKVLVQCKHWRGWKVQPNIVREMLGSMTHFGMAVGAIHTLQGWTRAAAEFANEHGIDLADEQELARRARASLTDEDLARWLLEETHRCPKCEAVMVLRTGDFKPFWGCSSYPSCRGTLASATAAGYD